MAVPVGPYGRLLGVFGFPCFAWPPWGRGRSPLTRKAAVGASPVPWAPYICCGGVAGPWDPSDGRGGVVGFLGPVHLPWGCGRFPGSRMAAVGA